MTAKKKAEQLVNEFRVVLMNEDTDCGNEILCTSIAVQNVRILVQNIVKELPNKHQHKWWFDVLNEANKI